MTYDGFTLAAVISELNSRLIGGKIQKIRQHNESDITLEIRVPGHTYNLFFSVDAKYPRTYLTATSAPVPQQAPNFCMVLRKYIEGSRIVSIKQVQMDRIMRLCLEYPDQTHLTLIFELMGKHSNLILVNSENKILGAIKHVGASVSRYRQVLPGRDYLSPPTSDKVDIRQIDELSLNQMWDASFSCLTADSNEVSQWLLNAFSGFGPFLADEVVKRVQENDNVFRDDLINELISIRDIVQNSRYEPVFITNERGEGLMVYPMPSVQFPASQQHPRTSINEALDALFRTLVTRSQIEDERSQLITSIRRALASRKQAMKSIERTLAEAGRADRYREVGELLLANLHSIEKGASSVRLVDFFDPQMPEVEIELDEKLTPQQNAERYFKRYQKARDSVAASQERRSIIEREMSMLDSSLIDARNAKSIDDLKKLRQLLVSQDLLRQDLLRERREDEFDGHKIRRHITPDGWEILYGENSQANDYLTQKIARPNDLWLHARSITGAHVVVRTAGHSGGVPRHILLQAAKIAAQNSEAKHSSLVPVDYTYRKYVRKPRGAAPGFTTYRNEKTLDINPHDG